MKFTEQQREKMNAAYCKIMKDGESMTMNEIYDMLLSAAAPQVVADEPTDAQMDKWYESASSAHQSLRADRYAFGRACYRAGMEAKKNES